MVAGSRIYNRPMQKQRMNHSKMGSVNRKDVRGLRASMAGIRLDKTEAEKNRDTWAVASMGRNNGSANTVKWAPMPTMQ